MKGCRQGWRCWRRQLVQQACSRGPELHYGLQIKATRESSPGNEPEAAIYQAVASKCRSPPGRCLRTLAGGLSSSKLHCNRSLSLCDCYGGPAGNAERAGLTSEAPNSKRRLPAAPCELSRTGSRRWEGNAPSPGRRQTGPHAVSEARRSTINGGKPNNSQPARQQSSSNSSISKTQPVEDQPTSAALGEHCTSGWQRIGLAAAVTFHTSCTRCPIVSCPSRDVSYPSLALHTVFVLRERENAAFPCVGACCKRGVALHEDGFHGQGTLA